MAPLNLMVTSGAYSSIHSMCAHSTEIISDVDLVLNSLQYYNEDNLVVQNDFYKDLDKHQFSAVVIVEGKSYSTKMRLSFWKSLVGSPLSLIEQMRMLVQAK